MRVRLVWLPPDKPGLHLQPEPGPWSAWHRVAVVQSFKDVAKPPKVLAPYPNRLFINEGVDVQIAAARKHPDPFRREFAFQWQRADYHTKANNHYADPNPVPADFPRVPGQASPFRAWHSHMPVKTLAESSGPSILHLSCAGLRPNRLDSSYVRTVSASASDCVERRHPRQLAPAARLQRRAMAP